MDFICFLFFFGFDGEDVRATIPIPGPVKGSSFTPELDFSLAACP